MTPQTDAEINDTETPERDARRRQFVPARWETPTFVLLLSGLMTLIVSAITTIRNLGIGSGFVDDWLTAFVSAWPITFPTALVVIPVVRRIVKAIVVPAASP